MENFLLAFIPIFVAVDPIGILPIFVSLTHGLDRQHRKKIILLSLTTAICLAVGFIFLGKLTFRILGITVGDFMIAGGGVLFCISIMDLLNPSKQHRLPSEEVGAVPIGTPLIVGPAVLTTSLIMMDAHGLATTLAAVLVNIFLVGIVFFSSEGLIRVLGEAGARVLSKVTSLLLAAIAVMMIRKGISFVLALP
ncbi:MAG: hypothetical protein A2787_06740 [Omnitrophica WOR_2 bacterium RIFCSPHIGHO2_01_FULL_48_9]|nr:MAG: hypothetical protein A3D10_09545 [Omnitrophica WOR_2 bacterium RIFCSPHIGHO2_02_FULL_48_11]OGX29961.1 MAG: hypothetical protein A2787_06740 [Omnitrophica WOR_2 bacterium RIFCSPHIGHO2_01_FULL_48_9]